MHPLVVTGVRSGGYRVELTRWAQKWGRRPRKWALKKVPSWIFSQLDALHTDEHSAASPVQTCSPSLSLCQQAEGNREQDSQGQERRHGG